MRNEREKDDMVCEPLPVKRTVKKYKIFPASSQRAAGRFLCGETQHMLLHRRQHAQAALHSPGIVIVDIAFHHLYEFLVERSACVLEASVAME
jgi:hypothetical protein